MNDKQPEALRLASALEQNKYLLSVERDATAAELRQLYEENRRLNMISGAQLYLIKKLQRINEDLLEALTLCRAEPVNLTFASDGTVIRAREKAASAIAKAEGK
jgi:hypothetical protein